MCVCRVKELNVHAQFMLTFGEETRTVFQLTHSAKKKLFIYFSRKTIKDKLKLQVVELCADMRSGHKCNTRKSHKLNYIPPPSHRIMQWFRWRQLKDGEQCRAASTSRARPIRMTDNDDERSPSLGCAVVQRGFKKLNGHLILKLYDFEAILAFHCHLVRATGKQNWKKTASRFKNMLSALMHTNMYYTAARRYNEHAAVPLNVPFCGGFDFFFICCIQKHLARTEGQWKIKVNIH